MNIAKYYSKSYNPSACCGNDCPYDYMNNDIKIQELEDKIIKLETKIVAIEHTTAKHELCEEPQRSYRCATDSLYKGNDSIWSRFWDMSGF